MLTLHILASPHSPVHISNRVDPFSIIVFKYIEHMTRLGWNCIYYSVVGSHVECESVQCLDSLDLEYDDRVVQYNRKAATEISTRKSSGDLVLCFYGSENKDAALYNNDLIIVEPSIGYRTDAVFAPNRVFVSYAQMHYYYGSRNMLMNPSWNDAVIFNPISKDEFTYSEDKDDYFLCFGRVIPEKGIHMAILATQAAGKRLIIAGPGDLSNLGFSQTPDHVELFGVCNVEQRRNLMSKAKAILGPTYYIEPFGNMIVEGYMCGTPAITTDWGGFVDTVVDGVTGFRCREFKEFVSAINRIDTINPEHCRKWAEENCDDYIVHKKHNDYLKKIIAGNLQENNKVLTYE